MLINYDYSLFSNLYIQTVIKPTLKVNQGMKDDRRYNVYSRLIADCSKIDFRATAILVANFLHKNNAETCTDCQLDLQLLATVPNCSKCDQMKMRLYSDWIPSLAHLIMLLFHFADILCLLFSLVDHNVILI